MLMFWTLAGLITALAGVLVLGHARRGADTIAPESDTGAAELAELDRLKARGLLDEDTLASARAEAARRLLTAPAVDAPPVVGGRDRTLTLGALIATCAVALGLYFGFGAPGLPDQSWERRVDDWASSPETLDAPQIAAVLTRAVRREPDNRTALTMLGAARFEAGDPIGAASAYRRALALDANDPVSWARLGESLVRAAEGDVGADAEVAFTRAIDLDPDQLGARYYLGEAALARGDVGRAREMWLPLIAVLDPADPRRADLVTRLGAAG
jgi:cytochrome c-type biogenesis protein CcmH